MGSRMIHLKSTLLCAMVAVSLVVHGYAQQPVPVQQPVADSTSSAAALQAFEGADDGEYRLGCGDQISIMVPGHPEATGKQTVGPDGIVTLPYAGAVKVADLTRDGAAQAITKALKPYYQDPTVVVGVDVYTSNNLVVLGAVERPGLMPVDSTTTLLSVVSRLGVAPDASPTIQGKSTSVPERVAVFRGTQNVLWIDFKQALENADPRLQLRLRKGDVVYIPSPHERYVSVFGEVMHPGLVELQDGATLVQLLAESGGILTDRSGRLPKIQVIHEFTGSIQTIDYEDVLKSRNFELRLESGDIVYVPESKLDRLAVTFQKVSPLISIATIASLIQRP